MKQLIEDISAQWGNLTSVQCRQLAAHFPDLEVVIKWATRRREKCPIKQVASRIDYVEKVHKDYCREVFLQREDLKKLKNMKMDVTPTWSALILPMVEVLKNPKANPQVKKDIESELLRCAKIADSVR